MGLRPVGHRRQIDEVDPAIERVIERCLQKEPAQRPGSVYEVLGAEFAPVREAVVATTEIGHVTVYDVPAMAPDDELIEIAARH